MLGLDDHIIIMLIPVLEALIFTFGEDLWRIPVKKLRLLKVLMNIIQSIVSQTFSKTLPTKMLNEISTQKIPPKSVTKIVYLTGILQGVCSDGCYKWAGVYI